MTMIEQLHEIRSILHAYRDFAECVVEDIQWSVHGTTISIVVDYPWRTDGSVRSDDDERLKVTLTFSLVDELSIKNRLREAVIEDPSLINWSHNEVAMVDIMAEPEKEGFSRMRFWWEGSTWMELVFRGMRLSEETVPPSAGWQ